MNKQIQKEMRLRSKREYAIKSPRMNVERNLLSMLGLRFNLLISENMRKREEHFQLRQGKSLTLINFWLAAEKIQNLWRKLKTEKRYKHEKKSDQIFDTWKLQKKVDENAKIEAEKAKMNEKPEIVPYTSLAVDKIKAFSKIDLMWKEIDEMYRSKVKQNISISSPTKNENTSSGLTVNPDEYVWSY